LSFLIHFDLEMLQR